MNQFCEITPELRRLAAKSAECSKIDPELYARYDVKRGLRDLNIDTLRCQHISPDIRLVEQNILCRIIGNVRIKKAVFLRQFLRFLFLKRNNDSVSRTIANTVHHMWFGCIDTAGNLNDAG